MRIATPTSTPTPPATTTHTVASTETPTPTPSLTPTVECIESFYGCCDFRGAEPCYPLTFGGDTAGCFNRGGVPRGCFGSVVCNQTTGLCEPPLPTPSF